MKYLKFLLVVCCFCVSAFANNQIKIENSNYSVEFKNKNVVVSDLSGNNLFALGKVHLYHTGSFGEISKAEKIDESSLRLKYRLNNIKDVDFETILKLKNNEIVLSYKIDGNDTFKKRLEGVMMYILKTKTFQGQ